MSDHVEVNNINVLFSKKENYTPITWHYEHATIIGLIARRKKENEMIMYMVYNYYISHPIIYNKTTYHIHNITTTWLS